ncbi:DUF4291 domain-containing protein [Dokdonia ponticola]|uniref:DUF4291 domain-containing protein n=1 Tax=Dokdonia ponticola TaxID=2041041 RepID=A0ABV9HU92_9FLAO
MKLQLKPYKEQLEDWPQTGQHIMAQYDEEKVIVYQSYRPEIGHFATQHQYFGGPFSLSRMTWIKPNFLWMMYRNGWGTKEGQEVVLAVHLKREAFERYLSLAVYSNYQKSIYETKEMWQKAVKSSNIRLQWDPDHDPYGAKLARRAIQIGIRNKEIEAYAKDDLLEIEDISAYVSEQYTHVRAHKLDQLVLPVECPYIPKDPEVSKRLQLTSV